MSIPELTRVSELFSYRNGELYAEDVPVRQIAAQVGTPFYVYSSAAFSERYRRFAAAFGAERPLICYAVKANSNLAVVRLFATLGAGADVVSEGELRRALTAGVPPERIVFSGIGKTAQEMTAALTAGIHQINVESVPELHQLSAIANGLGRIAPVVLRVNPDVDALTHAKIATGKKENKFGIDFDEAAAVYRLAKTLPGLAPVGFAVHIGSQLVDLEPYRHAFSRLAELVRAVRDTGLAVDRIDLGGGLGIRYRGECAPKIEDYAQLARSIFGGLDVSLAFEPGRILTASAGLLVTRVIYVKQAKTRRFVIVDAAMNDLIRPALYDAWHDIMTVDKPPLTVEFKPADVVGPVCETGDTFAVDRALPSLAPGDLIAFTAAGAYGAVMSSTYNSRLLVPEVLVAGARSAVIRARPSYEALLALDQIPAWLDQGAVAQPHRRGVA
ncbi:MAG: diaminopimelate decarboxylase [Alphaproteobacteria bacterium]|nr:diaminopimelate decarboxylase [Alphaproteobacteria bacterium]